MSGFAPQPNVLPEVSNKTPDKYPVQWGKLALIFASVTLLAFLALRLLFSPKDTVMADQTDGRVSSSQCELMGGERFELTSGRQGCKIDGAVFTVIK